MDFPRDNPKWDLVMRKYPRGKFQSIFTEYGVVFGEIFGYSRDFEHMILNVWGSFWYAKIDI